MKIGENVFLELSSVTEETVKEKIIALLKILYKDKNDIDDEVRLGIKKLKCIDEKDLRDLLIFGQSNETKLYEIYNKIMKFDKNYSRKDYENCIFYETSQRLKDMLHTDNMTDKELFVFANYNYVKELISKEKIDSIEKFHHRV